MMTNYTEKMANILSDLTKFHKISGIKTEFETEGASFDEALKLKQLADMYNLIFSIKIGGCGAIKDLYDTKKIGANAVVAPMIESPYAVIKFLKSIECVYKNDSIKAYINIETKNGIQYLDDILKSPFLNKITGIVAGRGDMACSLGYDCTMVNSNEIFEMVNLISQKYSKYDGNLIVGGGVTLSSIPFLKKLQNLDYFETRKIIFNKQALDYDIKKGITKAIEFEIMWLKSKNELLPTDIKRINTLETRLSNTNILQII